MYIFCDQSFFLSNKSQRLRLSYQALRCCTFKFLFFFGLDPLKTVHMLNLHPPELTPRPWPGRGEEGLDEAEKEELGESKGLALSRASNKQLIMRNSELFTFQKRHFSNLGVGLGTLTVNLTQQQG